MKKDMTIGKLMAESRRWLVYRMMSNGKGKPSKVPFYINGKARGLMPNGEHISLDTKEDMSNMATYQEAHAAMVAGKYAGLGFALGPDGTGNHWQGIDFDGISKRPSLVPLADKMTGYRETSPSGDGIHWIGYGTRFENLLPFEGVEAYSSARFFTVTQRDFIDCPLCDLSSVVGQHLAPLRPVIAVKPATGAFVAAKRDDCTIEQLKGYLSRIPVSKLGYFDWCNVLMGTHHQFAHTTDAETARAAVDEWSKGDVADGNLVPDPRYSPKGIASKWKSFGRNPALTAPGAARTIRTVRKWAERYTPVVMGAVIEQAQQQPFRTAAAFGACHVRQFMHDYPEQGWLIKSVLPNMGLAQAYGDTSVGKTFMVIDLMFAVAQGTPWRNHKAQQGNIIYVAAEGAAGVRKRFHAYGKHYGVEVEELPIIVLTVAPNIMEEEQFELLGRTIASAGETDLIVIDTLAQTMGGANENGSEGMGMAIARYTQLATALNTMVLLVHHSGKDASQGARGWSGQRGAMDAQFEVSASAAGLRSLKVTKAKDGVVGGIYPFRLQVIPLGVDSDGDEITSCVALPIDQVLATQEPQPIRKDARVRGGWQTKVMQHIGDALAMGLPLKYLNVVDAVRASIVPDIDKPDRRRDQLTRAIRQLEENGVLSISGDMIIPFDASSRKVEIESTEMKEEREAFMANPTNETPQLPFVGI